MRSTPFPFREGAGTTAAAPGGPLRIAGRDLYLIECSAPGRATRS